MSSLDAFNDMMGQFLNELVLTFPAEKTVGDYRAAFEASRVATPRATLESFMESVGPKASKVMAKDESLFTENVKDFEFLSAVWSSGPSPGTKAAIWQYLQTLHILGMTLSMFPPETLEAIENAAKKCADSGAFDPAAMQGLMAGLLGGSGENPLAALLGGAGAGRPPRPRPGQRQVRRRPGGPPPPLL